ncbi:MAG: hypothetical protein IKB98_09120 [Clostridia bacterium]|nr:hypothetical protein [Clostridia bacterium]
MLKRVSVLLLCALTLIACWWVNSKGVFTGLNVGKIEIYQKSNSSNAQIILVSDLEYKFLTNKYGEACFVDGKDFCLTEFLSHFDANLIFTETLSHGTSYYAYSPKIKYSKKINGEKINLHVFVGKNNVKVASPIIYGSY